MCPLNVQQYPLRIVGLAAVVTDWQPVRLAPATAKMHQTDAKPGGIEPAHDAGGVVRFDAALEAVQEQHDTAVSWAAPGQVQEIAVVELDAFPGDVDPPASPEESRPQRLRMVAAQPPCRPKSTVDQRHQWGSA